MASPTRRADHHQVQSGPARAVGVSPRGEAILGEPWFRTALDQAADAIVAVSLTGTIIDVSRGFASWSGWPSRDVVGQPLGILDGESAPGAHAAALGALVAGGDRWSGDLMSRRNDGTQVLAAATVAPVRDDAGTTIGAIFVIDDEGRDRELEARVADDRAARTALMATLAALPSADGPEILAEGIAGTLLALPGLEAVGVVGFEASGDALVLGNLDRAGPLIRTVELLPTARAAYLRARATDGPWVEAWHPQADHPYHAAIAERGIRALAYVPIRSDAGVVGLLVAGSRDEDAHGLAEHLPTLTDGAAVAGALLGPHLRQRASHRLAETRIRAIIADRAFAPVFQPIVELGSGSIVGYEALTRFVDGSPPDRVFAEAAGCGLSIELEAATLAAALAARHPLPVSAWLNLNVSAEILLAGEPLATLLDGRDREIVLELTEHLAVTDYAALRAAIDRFVPAVRLAVDDAGAGFASFRHILELRPDYVKIDRAIVGGIDADPARQALVGGLVHFASQTAMTLVGEGVETKREATALRRLGVPLGQGYHLGRPTLAGRLAPPVTGPRLPNRPGVAARPASDATPSAVGDEIGRAVNIGALLADALRTVGIESVADLRAAGALGSWERLRQASPLLATGTTLLRLEGAARGIRLTQLLPAERARLRLLAKLGRSAIRG